MTIDDQVIAGKWIDFAVAVERLAERVGDPDDFSVEPGSSLAGDDRATHPFEVSQAIRHIINATVDQLHGVKVVVHDSQQRHLAVSATLARTALENAATGLWILGPRSRSDRVERVLRWHTRNYHDFGTYIRTSDRVHGDILDRNDDALEQVRAVAEARGLDTETVLSGVSVTAPIKNAAEFTDLPVFTDWRMASGFAHARPWVHQGFLAREQISTDTEKHAVYRMTAREDMTIYFPLQALHLLGELLRLRDRRAGFLMPPLPDGAPDGEARARPLLGGSSGQVRPKLP